ncbi:hypothetical protein GGR27_003411 [Lewinella antarctica]|uniref:Uncharacterized protein n=1 Tax=Neolewinella antarctica TaxID=442734 RepID=A0ABX0XFA9_9BACT|nr:hypothetical protein [Neolewinella antarctica]
MSNQTTPNKMSPLAILGYVVVALMFFYFCYQSGGRVGEYFYNLSVKI